MKEGNVTRILWNDIEGLRVDSRVLRTAGVLKDVGKKTNIVIHGII